MRRALGVEAEVWDVPPRQRAYDVRIRYPDGRIGALEVTSEGLQDLRQLIALLDRLGYSLPLSGRFSWTIRVHHVRDLPWVKEHYAELVEVCEAHDVQRLVKLPHGTLPADVHSRALEAVELSRLTSDGGDQTRRASLLLPATEAGFAVDTDLRTLADVLEATLATDKIQNKIDKVVGAGVDEAHLYLSIHYSGLPTVYDGLAFDSTLPPSTPINMRGLTHLWLAPQFSRRVLLWDGSNWTAHQPFND